MSGPTSTLNIALPESMRAYVSERVESGQYGDTSEYVRELIRKDQREQARERLRTLAADGLSSGPAQADGPDDWSELRALAVGATE